MLWVQTVTLHLQTQQKPRVTEAQHNAEKHFLFILTSKFLGHYSSLVLTIEAPISVAILRI